LLTFRAIFTDGSNGIIVINTIPEPTAAMGLMIAVPMVLARRRVRSGVTVPG
jgi:hypothetical protein